MEIPAKDLPGGMWAESVARILRVGQEGKKWGREWMGG